MAKSLSPNPYETPQASQRDLFNPTLITWATLAKFSPWLPLKRPTPLFPVIAIPQRILCTKNNTYVGLTVHWAFSQMRDDRLVTQSIAIAVSPVYPEIHTLTSAATDGLIQHKLSYPYWTLTHFHQPCLFSHQIQNNNGKLWKLYVGSNYEAIIAHPKG